MSNDAPSPKFAGPFGRLHWSQAQRTGDPALKLLIIALASYADEQWSCWPSQQTLAHDSEQSLSTVKRQLKLLERLGLLRRERRFQGKANRLTDRYYLNSWLVLTAERVAAYKADQALGTDPRHAPQLSTTNPTTGHDDPSLDKTAGQEQGVNLTSGHNNRSELDRVTTHRELPGRLTTKSHQSDDHEGPTSMPTDFRARLRRSPAVDPS